MHALVITVAADEVELASDALWALGVVAVEERPGPHGTVELWTSLGDDVSYDDVGLPSRWPWRLEHVDPAVAETWREFAEPIEVDHDLVIRPAWVDYDAPAGVTVLTIDPGVTFGMGDHPTTMLSLRALRRALAASPGADVLDVGCGSGVLAVAAMAYGAASATGIDITPAAVPVTTANAEANGVVVAVSTTPLAEVTGRYGIVLANILAPTLVSLAADLRRVLADGGTLIVSGILSNAHDHVLDALAPLSAVATDEQDGWVAVTLR